MLCLIIVKEQADKTHIRNVVMGNGQTSSRVIMGILAFLNEFTYINVVLAKKILLK